MSTGREQPAEKAPAVGGPRLKDKPPLLLVGITGRSGSGKSSLSAYYASLGHPVADGDALSREVVLPGSPGLAALVQAFGGGILRPDGSLDRKRLGELAFATPRQNQKLIAITHPLIIGLLLEKTRAAYGAGRRLFFLDGAMIVGGPVQPWCDKIILLTAENRLSISRIILRDGISKTAAQSRLAAQPSLETLRAAADYVIDNSGSEAALRARADAVLAQLLALLPGPCGEVNNDAAKGND